MEKCEDPVSELFSAMNRLIRLFIGLLVFAIAIVIAGDLPPLQMKADKLMQAAHLLSSAQMEAILGSDRAEVLDLVRRVARSEVTEWVDRSQLIPALARWVLLRLPDPEALEIIGNQLAEYQYVSPYGTAGDHLFDDVLRTQQPKLLPYFARGVFRNEDADTRDFEWDSPGKINRSMNSLSCMLKLTNVIEEFSPQVKAWVQAMLKSYFLPENERRELGRAWWKENEKAILAGDYAAVRPGVSPTERDPRSHSSSLPDPDDARRVWSLRNNSAKPKDAATSPAVVPAADPRIEQSYTAHPYVWFGMGTLLLCGVTWLFLRYKKQNDG